MEERRRGLVSRSSRVASAMKKCSTTGEFLLSKYLVVHIAASKLVHSANSWLELLHITYPWMYDPLILPLNVQLTDNLLP